MSNPTLDSVETLPFQGLTTQTDGQDKKALEVLDTPIPPLEQGAVGTAPKDGQTKLDAVSEEEEGQVAQELRMWIEEEKIQTLHQSAKSRGKQHRHRGWMDLTIHF